MAKSVVVMTYPLKDRNETLSARELDRLQKKKSTAREAGFTLLELVLVIVIMSIIATLLGVRMGTFTFWREEGFIRKISETIQFLHHQAVVDGVFYRLEFDVNPQKPTYRIGEIVAEQVDYSNIEGLSSAEAETGQLSVELAQYLFPSDGEYQNMIPPRSFPSLAKPINFPENCYIEDVHTMRGTNDGSSDERPYIMFSPRGFSEFAVIHLRLTNDRPVTILVNPFTGLTEIYREYKEFEWTYGRNKK